jgi:hypothetical protein
MTNNNQTGEKTMKTNQTKEAKLLRAAYPLTNRGVVEVLEYVGDGDAKHLDWLTRHNPPGSKLAEILRALTAEQLAALWPKLETALAAQAAVREAKAVQEKANSELRDCLHPAEAAARQAAAEKEAADWWEREGKAEAEIEERGESKYYYYEKERAEMYGEEYTANDYLDGREAGDVENDK